MSRFKHFTSLRMLGGLPRKRSGPFWETWYGFRDAFLALPFEVTIALLSAIYGIVMVAGPEEAVATLPVFLAYVWGFGLIGFAVGSILGLMFRTNPKTEELGRAVERSGLMLGASVYLTIAIGALFLGSEYKSSLVQAIVIFIGCTGRLYTLRKVDKVITKALQDAGEE